MFVKPRFFDREAARYYLAAMIDVEGSVSIFQGTRKCLNRSIKVANYDRDIIAMTAAACEFFGIRWNVSISPAVNNQTSDCIHLCIYDQRSFQIVLNEIPIVSKRKLETLSVIVDSYKQAPRAARWKGSDAGWLLLGSVDVSTGARGPSTRRTMAELVAA